MSVGSDYIKEAILLADEPRQQQEFQPILERIRRTWPILPRRPAPVQFSLTQFWLVLTICACIFAVLGFFLRSNLWEKNLAERMRLSNVKVQWTHNEFSQPRICSVTFNSGTAAAEFLGEAAKLPMLESIYFSRSPGNADLKKLAGQERVRSLTFSDSLVSRAGIMHLGGIPNLERLTFVRTPAMGDSAVRELAKLKNLKELKFIQCSVTDQALMSLSESNSLRVICLPSFWVSPATTKAGVEELVRMKQLELLEWNGRVYEGKELEDWREMLLTE